MGGRRNAPQQSTAHIDAVQRLETGDATVFAGRCVWVLCSRAASLWLVVRGEAIQVGDNEHGRPRRVDGRPAALAFVIGRPIFHRAGGRCQQRRRGRARAHVVGLEWGRHGIFPETENSLRREHRSPHAGTTGKVAERLLCATREDDCVVEPCSHHSDGFALKDIQGMRSVLLLGRARTELRRDGVWALYDGRGPVRSTSQVHEPVRGCCVRKRAASRTLPHRSCDNIPR